MHGTESPEDLHIPSDVAQELGSELSKLTANPYGEATQFQFVAAAKDIMRARLPQECLARVEALRKGGHRGILRVCGLPVDTELGPTPVDGLEPLPGRASFVGEGVHLGMAALLGSVYTLEFEKGHRVIHTVAPVQGRETFPGSVGSSHAFGMHQEDRMHPYSPEVLVLTCLRADSEGQAETCTGSFWDIAPELCREENADVLQALQEANFALKLPLLFQQQGRVNEEVGPVLSFEEGMPSLAVNMNGMRALNARGQHALDMLSQLFEKTWSRMRMSSGEMVLILNRHAVHTRTTAFAVRGDGTDRWLLRTFVHPHPPAGVIPKARPEWNTMVTGVETQDVEAPGAEVPTDKGRGMLVGLALVALSGFLLSWMAICVSFANAELTSAEIALIRCVVSWVLVAGYCRLWLGISPWGAKAQRRRLLGRGLTGGLGMMLFYAGLSMLNPGDATTLYFSSPIFTVAFAAVFLGERVTLLAVLSVCVTAAGTVLVSRPEFLFGGTGGPAPLGVLVCLAAAACDAGAYIFIRSVGKSAHPAVFLNYLLSCGTLLLLLLGFIPLEGPWTLRPAQMVAISWQTALVLLGLVVSGILGQLALAAGLQRSAAGPAAVVRTVDVAFVFLWQALILQKPVAVLSASGAVLVVGGAVMVVLTRRT